MKFHVLDTNPITIYYRQLLSLTVGLTYPGKCHYFNTFRPLKTAIETILCHIIKVQNNLKNILTKLKWPRHVIIEPRNLWPHFVPGRFSSRTTFDSIWTDPFSKLDDFFHFRTVHFRDPSTFIENFQRWNEWRYLRVSRFHDLWRRKRKFCDGKRTNVTSHLRMRICGFLHCSDKWVLCQFVKMHPPLPIRRDPPSPCYFIRIFGINFRIEPRKPVILIDGWLR